MAKSTIQKVRQIGKLHKEVYNHLTDSYQKRINPEIDVFLVDSITECAKSRFEQPIKVLEIGPGVGSILERFEKEGFRTFGVEICDKMANMARERSPNSFIVQGDFAKLKFPSSSIQIIYAGAFIHLFPKDCALLLLKIFRKILVSNGILFVNTTIHTHPSEGLLEKEDYEDHLKRFRKCWTETEFIEAIELKGFHILKKLNREVDGKNWLGLICENTKLS